MATIISQKERFCSSVRQAKSMDVRYVEDEGGLGTSAGFIECVDGRETRFVRIPQATVRLIVEAPKIYKMIQYQALRDARRTATTPSFPGSQSGSDLERSVVTRLRGKASLSGLGAWVTTTISPLGSPQNLSMIDVQLQTAFLRDSEEVIGFGVEWFDKEYIEPDGGFLFTGYLTRQDVDLLVEELRAISGNLEIYLTVGNFPGVFGEWSFDGWDGGKLKFANREICSRVVSNYEEIPDDFFDPEEPYDTRVETIGPHELVRMFAVSAS